jgi:hypothetical protein
MESSVGPVSEFLPLRTRPVNWSGKGCVQIHLHRTPPNGERG